jgi:MFS-type transporter involved in bile tolerance (Atg22 family)
VGEALAMVNCCGALGGFAGTYLVGLLEAITHKPNAGFLLMAVALLASSFLLFALPKQTAREVALA